MPYISFETGKKNNRYDHPNKEVSNNLENSYIYRTDRNIWSIERNKI